MRSIKKYKYIFAAGGTGGHLYPALAVAEQIKLMEPDSSILFVGTKNKLEAKVVPSSGYDFKSIWISGIKRKWTIENLSFPLKVLVSFFQSFWTNLKYRPQVAIGAGAYVSWPVLWSAALLGIKVVLLEQNSYPGITNRLLEKKAFKIYTSFDESKQYFRDISKIENVGNPIRSKIKISDREIALDKLGLAKDKKTILILGGSLGAKSINNAIKLNIKKLLKSNIQILWQCGQLYYDDFKELNSESVKVVAFISDMEIAYSAADIIVARAGATTIAEVSSLGLSVIFVPSPNVAANHQYKNAETLTKNNAAELIDDKNVNDELVSKINYLLDNPNRVVELKQNIKKFARDNASGIIANNIIKMAKVV